MTQEQQQQRLQRFGGKIVRYDTMPTGTRSDSGLVVACKCGRNGLSWATVCQPSQTVVHAALFDILGRSLVDVCEVSA